MNVRSIVIAAFLCIVSMQAAAIDASNRYRSPRNPERKIRRSTELIVLHTTEAAARGSLKKVSERGECHFCVTEDGSVYRIVDRDREAFHAGRSMWNGKEDVDKYSIGIECVGYHDKPMSMAQLKAIAQLVKELQSMYHIADHCVVAHSHVAYGAPNRWQKNKHRGRKRCGMLFATTTIRRILNLKTRPAYDPDVRAKRLVVGDAYLNKVLYAGLDTMAKNYPKPDPASEKPKANAKAATTAPKKDAAPKQNVPATPKKEAAAPKATTAIKAAPKTLADLKALGYTSRGIVGAGQSPIKLVGGKWNAPDTFYVIRNKVTPGNTIDPARIEKGTSIWTK